MKQLAWNVARGVAVALLLALNFLLLPKGVSARGEERTGYCVFNEQENVWNCEQDACPPGACNCDCDFHCIQIGCSR